MFTCCGAERALPWPKFGPPKMRKVINKVHHLLRSTLTLREKMKGRYWSILKKGRNLRVSYSERENGRESVNSSQFSSLIEAVIHLMMIMTDDRLTG